VTFCLKNGLPLVQERRLRADVRGAGCRCRRGGCASRVSFCRLTICRSARSPCFLVANWLVISGVSLADLPIEQASFRVREEDRRQGVGAFPDRISKAVCLSHTGRKADRANAFLRKGVASDWRCVFSEWDGGVLEVVPEGSGDRARL
jgi:hypothetical protein